jgi:hypothetical protein
MPTPSQSNQIQELKALIEKATNKMEHIAEELPKTYVTRADYERGQENLEEVTTRISEKLDKLSDDLPNRFLDRLQYTSGHAELTNRIATGETRVEELRKEVAVEKQRVNELNVNSTQWANQTFTEIRELINKRSDTQDKKLNQIQLEAATRDKANAEQKMDQQKKARSQVGFVLLGALSSGVLGFIGTILLHVWHIL